MFALFWLSFQHNNKQYNNFFFMLSFCLMKWDLIHIICNCGIWNREQCMYNVAMWKYLIYYINIIIIFTRYDWIDLMLENLSAKLFKHIVKVSPLKLQDFFLFFHSAQSISFRISFKAGWHLSFEQSSLRIFFLTRWQVFVLLFFFLFIYLFFLIKYDSML